MKKVTELGLHQVVKKSHVFSSYENKLLKSDDNKTSAKEKRFSCGYCGSKFSTSSNKKRHEKKHGKESQCEESSIMKSSQADSILLVKYKIKPSKVCLKKFDNLSIGDSIRVIPDLDLSVTRNVDDENDDIWEAKNNKTKEITYDSHLEKLVEESIQDTTEDEENLKVPRKNCHQKANELPLCFYMSF